jgi:WD40 repeat protein
MKKIEKAKEDILVVNDTIFPSVGKIGLSNKITYIGHPKPVIKLVLIKTLKYPNHLCSLSIDGKIKLWSIEENDIKCVKCIDTNFETRDMIRGNNNDIIVCGEEIIIINLETEEKIIIKEKKPFKFVEFNLLAKINYDVGVCTSLNDYYLLFDLNKGKIIKQIEMNKTHFICQMEKNQKIKMKEEEEEEKKKEEEKTIYDDYNENDKKKKEEKKIVRDLGSGKCEIYEDGHKGHVLVLLGINTEENKDSIISGGEDKLIKIININQERKVINLNGHSNAIKSLVLDKTNQFLFSGSFDYTIKKWDLNKKECVGTMEYNNAYQNILLSLDNDFLLSIGINSKITIWNENCVFVKIYKYTHSSIKSGEIISYEKEFNKTKFVFGDEKGNIFIKQFIIGESYINKYKDFMEKQQKENEDKLNKPRKNKKSFVKSMIKLNFKDKEMDKNFNFKEITNETQNTEN